MLAEILRLVAREVDETKPEQFAAPTRYTEEEWALLPHDHQGPKLVAVSWVLWTISTAFLALRLYCRVLKRQSLWWDDAFLIGATLCMTVEVILITYMVVNYGYGLHFWDFDLNNMQYLMLPMNISGTLSVTSAVWSKTSFGITLLHLTNGWLKRITWFCIISMNIVMGLSALFPWVQCKPINKVWDLTIAGECWAPTVLPHYNMFSGGWSALMDIVLALLPWKFLWGLQMKTSEKIGVGFAMSMGIFAGITAIIKTTMVPRMLSDDFADGIDLWIWNIAEVSVTVIAASIPMLRVLVRDAKTSRQYHSGYIKETGVSGNRSRMVTIQSKAARMNSETEMHKMGDDRSDRSILAGNEKKNCGIVQVVDFTVKYDDDDDASKKV
ncbi:hypothetical protein QBC38DRAFT_548146 [Podospora fimiseda]|uniref:Rhodopsin domain-containing protein n=1 Tax=Podospora fimiseda TaxID=252190 RepID=A0AAN7GT00_9PEZI|nr:hypothetical protein QBC38DRAFT_548146 [Podospora fimiseda]